VDFQALVEALSSPSAYPRPGRDVSVVHTHVSVVFLTGDRAYKVKKPVRFWGFLDYGTVERRKRLCEEEVRLNRRLAPEVYLGVVPIVRRDGRVVVGGEGEPVEHAVEMVRFDERATLAGLVSRGEATREDVLEAARVVRRFHATARRDADVLREGRPVVFARILRANVGSTRRHVPETFPAALHEAVVSRLAACLRESRARLRRRAAERRLVEGHGDLRAEHFVRLDPSRPAGWIVVDAIEFTARLRSLDPLSDAAFLSTDLRSLARPDLASAFEDAYLGDPPDLDARHVLPLFLAYRAHVRANVDALRSRDEAVPAGARERAASSARRHLALAWSLSRRGRAPPLVVMVGPSGVGKSVVADAVAPLLDAEVLRSDVVRKRLAGFRPTERATGRALRALYSARVSSRTYAEMLRGAERALRAGRAAVLDATYLLRRGREAAAALARRLGSPYAFLAVEVPPEEARARIERRLARDTDPSDATSEVYEEQVATAEPLGAREARRAVLWDGRADPKDAFAAVVEVLCR
jgi:aminoglycoside phosphotransferase family enzyme/predicted kinase